MERVIAYIDGFNLYFGLKDRNWRRYYWLNLQKLVKNLLKPNQTLVKTNYFTSRISKSPLKPGKGKRQRIYLEALNMLPNLKIFYGFYLEKERLCKRCGASYISYEEKMTDVNISIEMLNDAYQDNFDTAFLISGDSDLVGPVKTIRRIFTRKRIVVGFPPDRHSINLKKVANAYFMIGRKKIADSLFADTIKKPDGFYLHRPKSWK